MTRVPKWAFVVILIIGAFFSVVTYNTFKEPRVPWSILTK